MKLTSLDLPRILDTSDSDIIADFFIPALGASVRYDRGVGFFSAAWLRLAAAGMAAFARSHGRARWVTSPILSEEDWQALELGEAARYDEVLRRSIERSLDDLELSLENKTLSALAWLVADGVLDFRLALPRNKLAAGEFHDKFGIFSDGDGNQVSFNGSYNDSVQGTRNYESIKVFRSWDPAYVELVHSDAERFERLWNNFDQNVQVFDLPRAARARIVRLRTHDRPYPAPQKSLLSSISDEPVSYDVQPPLRPRVPNAITLRDYQVKAVEAWFGAGSKGLFEMATGTGKTITALAASVRFYEQERRLALVIACPYQHLVDQWYDEARRFGYSPIRAYNSRSSWLDALNDRVVAYNHRDISALCVVTTHATFCSDHFQRTLRRVRGAKLLIADEVHHLGTETARRYYPEEFEARLALSATPQRWYDEAGTSALRGYFGQTVFQLSLSQAIGKHLTPYYYYPVLVELTERELEEYRVLSTRIGQEMARGDNADEDVLRRLLMKRAHLLNTAENKIGTISELVDQQKRIKHALFYCTHGQIDALVSMLGWEKRLRVHRFTAREDIPTRQDLLARFAEGELQALVAMHCLDEGVDVPSTRTAYILASSSNPRQFIQRRGRILRKSPGKESASIFDLITVPPSAQQLDEQSLNAERSILRRELARFAEFADSALNSATAYDVIWDLADRFGVLDFH